MSSNDDVQREYSALQDSLRVAKILREQNEEYKSALSELKEEYITLSNEHSALKKDFEHEVSAKKSVESDCKALYKKWNDELKVQAQEFEKMQSSMIPSTELELLRVNIVSEVEASYQEKLHWSQTEMAKFRDLHTKAVRELEILKSTHCAAKNKFDEELREQNDAFNRKLQAMQRELEEIAKERERDDIGAIKQSLTDAKRQTLCANEEIAVLRKRVESLDRELADAHTELEEARIAAVEREKALEGEVMLKEAECEGLRTRFDDFRAEFDESKAKHLEREHSLQTLETERTALRSQITSKQTEMDAMADSFAKKERTAHEAHCAEIAALETRIATAESALSAMSKKCDDLKMELNKAKDARLSEAQRLKEEHFEAFSSLMRTKQETDGELQSLRGKFEQFEAAKSAEMDELSRELQETTMRVRQLREEKEKSAVTAKKQQSEIQELLNDVGCLKKENLAMSGEYESLTDKHRAVLDANYKLTTAESARLTQIEFLEKDIAGIHAKIDEKLTTLRTAHAQEMSAQSAAAEERSQTDARSICKLKKEKQRYKKLATLSKQKVAALSKDLKSIKRSFEAELRAKSHEITNLNRQIYQIERQRDEIKFRLTMDTHSIPNNGSTLSATQHSGDAISNNVDILLKELESQQKKLDEHAESRD